MQLPRRLAPLYIVRDYPEQSKNWPQFVREVEGFENLLSSDLPPADMWKAVASWFLRWESPVNEHHGRGSSTFYKVPKEYPWAIFGRSHSTLQRSVYISMESSNCDVRTLAEFTQD